MPTVGDAITIGVREGSKVGRKLIVDAKGQPAKIVAAGVAAGTIIIAAGIYHGVKHLIVSRGKKGELPEPR